MRDILHCFQVDLMFSHCLKDARPLIEKLQFDKKLLGVMQQIFGSTLVCRTLDVAVRVAKSGFNCVTLEGTVDDYTVNTLLVS